MDVLVRNLIHMMIKLHRDHPRSHHLHQLVQAVRDCGISFNVWEPRDAVGKKTGTYEWTSLMGPDVKRLLKVS